MNLPELQQYVWKRCPLGKHVIGRGTLDDLVQLTVEQWQGHYLNHATTAEQRQIVCAAIESSVKRGHQLVSGKEPQEYGFIWAFVLQIMVSAIIKILLDWWLERASNRVFLLTMQSELTK